MKELTAQEARAEASARNDIARMKKEIYEHIYKAATKGKYSVVYHPEHIELEMAHYVLMMHEFGNKGYRVAWFNNRNELLIVWKGEEREYVYCGVGQRIDTSFSFCINRRES